MKRVTILYPCSKSVWRMPTDNFLYILLSPTVWRQEQGVHEAGLSTWCKGRKRSLLQSMWGVNEGKNETCCPRRLGYCHLTSQKILVLFFLASLKCLPHARSSVKVFWAQWANDRLGAQFGSGVSVSSQGHVLRIAAILFFFFFEV